MVIFDLHTHTRYSDGSASLSCLVEKAARNGYGLGVSDHIFCGGNDTIPKIDAYLDAVSQYEHVLRGVEANIGDDYTLLGSLDEKLDYVIASVHDVWTDGGRYNLGRYFCTRNEGKGQYDRPYPPDQAKQCLERLLGIVETCFKTQRADILGHCTVNPMYEDLSGNDPLFLLQWEDALLDLCEKYSVALELSGLWREPGEALARRAKARGIKFTLGSDGHQPEELCDLRYPLSLAEALGLTEKDFFLPVRRKNG